MDEMLAEEPIGIADEKINICFKERSKQNTMVLKLIDMVNNHCL